jgi:hypothetical protein
MPRQFGKIDESAGWPNLPCCPYRHRVTTACPPAGAWLVLLLCHHCNPKTGLYCKTHRDRTMPALQLVDAPPVDDVQMLRTGEGAA